MSLHLNQAVFTLMHQSSLMQILKKKPCDIVIKCNSTKNQIVLYTNISPDSSASIRTSVEEMRHYAFLILIVWTQASPETYGRCSIIYHGVHKFLSHSAAHLKPGRPAAGPVRPEGRGGDGGQLRRLCGPQVWSRDRKLHLLCSGKPVGIQEVSPSGGI